MDKTVAPSGNAPITNTVTAILNNGYVFAVLAILAFSYGQRAGPKLPQWMVDFFSKDIMRVLFLSLLLFVRFETRPTVAIIIALVFVYILQYIYIEQANEQFMTDLNESFISMFDDGYVWSAGMSNELYYQNGQNRRRDRDEKKKILKQ